MLCVFNCVCRFATPRTVALQAPLSMGFSIKNTRMGYYALLQGSSEPRDRTCACCVSCIGRQILYCLSHLEAQRCSEELPVPEIYLLLPSSPLPAQPRGVWSPSSAQPPSPCAESDCSFLEGGDYLINICDEITNSI